jgi:amino acid permease
MKKFQTVIGTLVGIMCLVLAIIYWTTPAGSLPTWLPGFAIGDGAVHVKHGVVAFIVALAAFAYAWFSSGKKKK